MLSWQEVTVPRLLSTTGKRSASPLGNMNTSNFYSRISSASASAVRLLAEAKNAAQIVSDNAALFHAQLAESKAADTTDDSIAGAMDEEHASRNVPPTDSKATNDGNAISATTMSDAKVLSAPALIAKSVGGVEGDGNGNQPMPILNICSNNKDDNREVISNTPSITASTSVDYMSRFKNIALLAARATPVTSMMLAGHAHSVAKSVVGAAKSAVDSVEATKTAMRIRKERVRTILFTIIPALFTFTICISVLLYLL